VSTRTSRYITFARLALAGKTSKTSAVKGRTLLWPVDPDGDWKQQAGTPTDVLIADIDNRDDRESSCS